MKSVDIIIPIYNAYEDLLLCLDSIYKNTDLNQNRLILINDNSPDNRIKELLDKQKKENVIVIHNEVNKGFSNNINIGMAQSDNNDVILLNSDTVVTSNWVEKIEKCAYHDKAIGTVTPLSNNATLCSVPVFCEENKLPEGMSIEQAGQIVETCSLKKYPRITVAHGFCMYVKREVIKKIGGFDAETFERGYGEENDFCNRAEQIGYHHVMCDDTYIYHSGTKSFISKEKEAYIKAHDRILRERYPLQMKKNDLHCKENPNYYVGDNVSIYFDLNNGKKNVLYLLQSDFREGSENCVGGTQFHVRDLVQGLRKKCNVFVAARDKEYLNLTMYYGSKERTFKYYIGEKETFFEFNNIVIEKLWRNILSAFQIDLIHVHHVLTTSFDIFYVAKEYNIPIMFTAHDFYFVCPTIKLLNQDGKVCVGRKDNRCVDCLHSLLGITDKVDYIKNWREKCSEVLEVCDKVIVPDQSAVDILLQYYPILKEKLIVIPHGYSLGIASSSPDVECTNEVVQNIEKIEKEGNTYSVRGWAYLKNAKVKNNKIYMYVQNSKGQSIDIPCSLEKRLDVCTGNAEDKVGFFAVIPEGIINGEELEIRIVIEENRKLYCAIDILKTPKLSIIHKENLNIAFIGGLSKEKGGEEIYSIIKQKKDGVNWFIFGNIGVQELDELKQKNLVKTGGYSPMDLPTLLKVHKIDVVGILSIWPETYSYTVTEALINHVPVIVTDIGALGRRVSELKCGWTVSVNNTKEEFLDLINQITTSSMLNDVKRIIDNIKISSIGDMTHTYEELYSKLWEREISYEKAEYNLIYQGCSYNRKSTSGENVATIENIEVISDMKKEMDVIKQSVAYRVVNKIWKTPIPGRKIVKKIIKSFL